MMVVCGARILVLPWITTAVPLESRLITVLETVMGGPPGMSVVPGARTYWPAELAVKTWLSEKRVMRGAMVVVIIAALGMMSVVVTPFTTRAVADGRSERVVPSTVIAGPPGARICPDTVYCDCGFAVNVWPPTTTGARTGGGVIWAGCAIATVELPTTTSVRSLLVCITIGVLSTMTVWPGATVVLPTTAVCPEDIVVEPPITQFPPVGSLLIITWDVPTVTVALGGGEDVGS